jgi:hypothetical protein
MLIHQLPIGLLIACLFVHHPLLVCSPTCHLFVIFSPSHSLSTCLHIAYSSPLHLHVTFPFACRFFAYVLHVPHLHVTCSLFTHCLCLICSPMCHVLTYPPNMLLLAHHLLHNTTPFILPPYTSFRTRSPTSIKILFFKISFVNIVFFSFETIFSFFIHFLNLKNNSNYSFFFSFPFVIFFLL